MAHVPLSPLGRPRDAVLDESSYPRHREAMAEKTALLEERKRGAGLAAARVVPQRQF